MTTADNELQERIERELAWDPEVTADHVGVTVKDGVVGLNGFVPTYAVHRTKLWRLRRRIDNLERNALVADAPAPAPVAEPAVPLSPGDGA